MSREILRVRGPQITTLMHFFDDDDSTQDEDRNALVSVLIHEPEAICVAVVFEDGELVSHVCGKRDERWVWVYNAWARQGVKKIHSMECFNIIKNWAKKLGINQLRCETYRNPASMGRAYGWEKYSTIMKLDLGIAQ